MRALPACAAALLLFALAAACGDDESSAAGTDADGGADIDSVDVVDDTTEPDGGGADVADEDATDAGDDTVDVVEDTGPITASSCFADLPGGDELGPNYDPFEPVVGAHCFGTDHQDITGIEKIVFLGDSVTAGTPPSYPEEYYRNVLVDLLEPEFGELEVDAEFARFGARTDDLLQDPHKEILMAFPDVEPRRTLVVMTIGGNDVFKWAESHAEGASAEEIDALVDQAITYMREAIQWFRDNEDRFPAGVFVVFTNVFEFTDGTGDTQSCELAGAVGLSEPWPEGREPVSRFNEAFMQIAVETGTDLVFMLEHFCGHGFRRDDPMGPCYRGPDAEAWFDFTCIHPNPTGHRALAEMIYAVVMDRAYEAPPQP